MTSDATGPVPAMSPDFWPPGYTDEQKAAYWKKTLFRRRQMDGEIPRTSPFSEREPRHGSSVHVPEAYVPPGREAFLPLGCRSGWELMVALEYRHGFKIFGYDLCAEKDIIDRCTDFMESRGYLP